MQKKAKKRIVAYIPSPLYDLLMKDVLKRVQDQKKFRGFISQIVIEALEKYYSEKETDV